MQLQPVIGLEVHVKLNTASKLFSAAPATVLNDEPNTNLSLVDFALPGVLPVPNQAVIEKAIKFGLAIDAKINQHSLFARKSYFYPDLPKGYQITQFDQPIIEQGKLPTQLVDNEIHTIAINRAHLEEDAGKSVHDKFSNETGIDLNRCGSPLLEVVTEPCLFSVENALTAVKALHQLVRYLDICDGNMQSGSFRVDVNISLKPKDSEKLGTRVEIKNLNSFRFIEQALRFEIERQADCLYSGGKIIQETRLFDSGSQVTKSMRGKEEAGEYRYFPDPDLPPCTISTDTIVKLKKTAAELPLSKQLRFMESYQLSQEDAAFLCETREVADYFEGLIDQQIKIKTAINWLKGEVSGYLNQHNITLSQLPLTAEQLAKLLVYIDQDQITHSQAKIIFSELLKADTSVENILSTHGFLEHSDEAALRNMIQEVLENHPAQVAQYKAGKTKVLGFLVGQVMKASGGKVNAKKVSQNLISFLS